MELAEHANLLAKHAADQWMSESWISNYGWVKQRSVVSLLHCDFTVAPVLAPPIAILLKSVRQPRGWPVKQGETLIQGIADLDSFSKITAETPSV